MEEKSIKSIAINYGLYLGLALVLITITIYAIDVTIFTNFILSIALLAVIVIAGILSAIKSKKILNGFISFKNAFIAYFTTVAIGVVISSIVSIVLFNYIDPEAATALNEAIIESTANTMQQFGAPSEAIDKTIEEMEKSGSQFEVGKQLTSVAFQLVLYAIIGLIAAAIIKKNPETNN